MAELTLYTHPWSRGRIVRWILEELGVDYDVVVKEFGGTMKAPDYLAINPMGKVPALVHGNTVVTEVAAICTYLADRFPQGHLAPALDSPERGTFCRWMFFIAGPFEMAATATKYGWTINRDNAQAVGCGLTPDTVTTLESALQQGPYLCGTQFTAADILAACSLGWFMEQKVVAPRPVFREYVDRLQKRPAAIRANALDDALVETKEPAPMSNSQ